MLIYWYDNHHTNKASMSAAKIAITLDQSLLQQVDRWVEKKLYSNRSQAIQAAIATRARQLDEELFALECAKLDPAEEQEFAELGMEGVLQEWSEY
jgi:Arc/MetJ-type ribon-helix-helix transcriptional regulator